MTVRLATPADVPAIAVATRDYYESIAFGPLIGTYEEEHTMVGLASCNEPDSVLIVAEENGKLAGVFFALILRSTVPQRKIAVAQELIFHADLALTPYRRIKILQELLTVADCQMKEKGVILSSIGTRLDAPTTGHLLHSAGYLATGMNWCKEL